MMLRNIQNVGSCVLTVMKSMPRCCDSVRAHRLDAQREVCRNLRDRLAARQHSQHLVLPIGQALVGPLAPVGMQPEREQLGQRRADVFLAAEQMIDGRHQLGRRALLGDVPVCAGAQRAAREFRRGVHAQDQHGQLRPLAPQQLDEVETAEARHGEVEDDQVPLSAADLRERLIASAGLVNRRVDERGSQDVVYALANDGVVIHEEDASHGSHEPGRVPVGGASS